MSRALAAAPSVAAVAVTAVIAVRMGRWAGTHAADAWLHLAHR